MLSYEFNSPILEELEKFSTYLEGKSFAKDTIRQYKNYTGTYLEWLADRQVEARKIKYKDFSHFIFYLKDERVNSVGADVRGTSDGVNRKAGGLGLSLNQCKSIILAVRHYYDWLKVAKNPASGIYIKTSRSSVLNRVVDYKKLMELYENYQVLDDRDLRNKVILGLYIYQAITTSELQNLEPGHIKLRDHKIHLVGTNNVKSRTLDLQINQLLDLQNYLQVIRPRMLENIKSNRPGKRPKSIHPKIYDQLFFSQNGSSEIKSSIHHLFRQVKNQFPQITSGTVIRSTVIAHWLKSKDVRIVQYMAGHRWVSSTERYDIHNLEKLSEQVNKYHPLK